MVLHKNIFHHETITSEMRFLKLLSLLHYIINIKYASFKVLKKCNKISQSIIFLNKFSCNLIV